MMQVYPRPYRTRDGDGNLNPHRGSIAVPGPIFRLQVHPPLRLRATLALYKSSAGFATA